MWSFAPKGVFHVKRVECSSSRTPNSLLFVICVQGLHKRKLRHCYTFSIYGTLLIGFVFLESRLDSTYGKLGTKQSSKERLQHIQPRIQFFPSNDCRNVCCSVHVYSLLCRLCRSRVSATAKTSKKGSSWIGRGRKRSLSTYSLSCLLVVVVSNRERCEWYTWDDYLSEIAID